jgi:asparagine synthase (glutamine-hydrolysing)
MGDCLAHRGPDEAGFYSLVDGRVSAHLAHRRLSIIDLSHGQQPFVKDGLALCYNGELYNYRELRSELASRGSRFRTDSDTEVVLEAWRQWGPDGLERLRGMFAFAILDTRTGNLYLARDPLGIKPLHYMIRKDGVVFASELKALVDAFGDELHMDPGALVSSMLYYWVPDRRCSVREIEKLQPGTWAEFRPDGAHRIGRYWDPVEVAAEAASGNEVDLGAVIEESVRCHLVSDVPVSSFLSGGLDSSIITVLAGKARSGIDAYTITFRPEDQRLEAMPDDAVYARKVAARFGVDLHEIEISPDVVELLPRMVGILDEPTGDPAAINTLLMCEAARDAGVKVILSGMGADELFGGYRKHVACLLSARYQRLPSGARAAARSVVGGLPVTAGGRGLRYARWAKRFITFSELAEEPAFRRSYTLYDPEELEGLVGRDLAPYVDDVVEEHASLYHDNRLDDHINRMCLADSRHFLPGLNLAYTDRASMAASTEVRVPFVDAEVFRAAYSLRGDQKIQGRSGKVALKRAALAWLPKEVVYRPKASFSAPLRAWIAHDLSGVVDEVLVRGELVTSGFLSRTSVEALVDDERAGREDRSKQIWQLLTLELWYRRNRAAGVTL